MTSLSALLSTAATNVYSSVSQLHLRALSALDDPSTRVIAGGIIDTAQQTVQQLQALAVGVGVFAAVVVFVIVSAKGGWSLGALIRALIIGGLIGFAVGGGGTVWIGNQFKQQVGS